MRRSLFVFALAALVAGGAFARPMLSAGGGLMFDGGRIGGVSGQGIRAEMDAFGFGAYGFFDARFVEASIGFVGGPLSFEFRDNWFPLDNFSLDGSFFAMDLSLLGKFPFSVGGGNITLFPLFGLGFNVVLSAGGDFGDALDLFGASPSELSTFRLQFGGGADFDITESIFIRTSILGVWRFPPQFARDMADWYPGISANGGFGTNIRVGVGFRF